MKVQFKIYRDEVVEQDLINFKTWNAPYPQNNDTVTVMVDDTEYFGLVRRADWDFINNTVTFIIDNLE
jgi:hypothetical protein